MSRSASFWRTVCLLLAVSAIAGGTPVMAAEKVFNLPKTVEFALQNNGELKALREEKGVREAGKIRAGLFPNPVLELEGTTGELTGSRFENTFSIGFSQELPTMGKRGRRLRVAEKDIEIFDRQAANSVRLFAGEVKTAFFELLLAEKRVELAERSISLNRQLLEIAGDRFDLGDIPELEVNLARVEASRSEAGKADAERELHPARARLISLMGLAPDEIAIFSGSLEAAPVTGSLADLINLALVNRPDLKALEAEMGKGEAEMALARAERIPDVTVGIAYQREHSAIDVAGEEVKSRDNLIGVKLSIPIPLFDRNQAGVLEARSHRQSAESRYNFARSTIEKEIEAAFARLRMAEKSVAIYSQSIIPQLEENLELVLEAYRLGEVGILSVIEEQKKFFEVNNGYLAALYDRRTALVKLETAVGESLE